VAQIEEEKCKTTSVAIFRFETLAPSFFCSFGENAPKKKKRVCKKRNEQEKEKINVCAMHS
jgi:hypothetical protein